MACKSKKAKFVLSKRLSYYKRSCNISIGSVSKTSWNVYYFCTLFVNLFFHLCFRTIILISLFSQYLTKITIPVPGYSKERGRVYVGRFPLFKLFPVCTCFDRCFATSLLCILFSHSFFNLTRVTWSVAQVILAVVVSWIICAVITAAGGFPSDPSVPQYMARADARAAVVKEAKWFRIPYPG